MKESKMTETIKRFAPPVKLISLKDFERGLGTKIEDDTTRASAKWVCELAKASDVDISDTNEVLLFSKYVILCLHKAHGLFKYLVENNIEIRSLEIMNQGQED